MAKFVRNGNFPEWFKLQHYFFASKLAPADWFRLITQRFYLLELLETGQGYKERDPELARAYRGAFARNIQNMRGMAVEDTDIPGYFGANQYAEYLANASCSVRPLTLEDFYLHALNTHGYPAELQEWLNDPGPIFAIDGDIKAQAPLLLNSASGSSDGCIALHADLNQPDKVLIRDLEVELPKIRAATNHYPRKTTYRPKFDSWARYGLLPYLDLLIWQMETGAKISQDEMALAITPHRDGNNLRTTIITAKRLRKTRCIEVLQVALAEHATANTTPAH